MKHHTNARTSLHLSLAITGILLSSATGNAASPSSLVLSSSINPSALGQSITLTATVSPGGATGKVTFYDGTIILATRAVAGGKAALTTTLLPFGSRSLKAHYEGDATYQPSTAPSLAQTVNAVQGFGFDPPVDYGGRADCVVIADFNGDGRADIANCVLTHVDVRFGNGDGTFQTAISTPTGTDTIGAAVSGDFNGDGRMDLLVLGSYYSPVINRQLLVFYLLAGRGDGTFNPPVSIPPVGEIVGLAVGDFNGDGFADVAVVQPNVQPNSLPTLTVLLGNGDGTFHSSVFTIPMWGGLAVADFNGDGKADLAVAGFADCCFDVFLGNGDGTFQAPLSFPLVNGLQTFAIGDFNGDGKLDVATSNGTISILTGNGDGTFRQTATYGSTNDYGPITVGDFNGDGIPDLAFSNFNGDVISLMLGKSDGTFEVTSRSVSPIACCPVAGEFSTDGVTDLAAESRETADLFVLLGKSNPGPTQSSVSMTASPNPSFDGESVNLTAIVVATSAIGTVTFRDGSFPLGSLGTAVLTPNFTAALAAPISPPGSRSLYAEFSGNANDLPSTSVSVRQDVLPEIVPIPVPPGSPPLTGNLLVNPGAESLLLGWSGAGFDVTSTAPHSGTESFYATQIAKLFGSQTVSLLAIPNVTQADIDSGTLSANYSYWYKNRSSATGGTYQITLTFYQGENADQATRIGQGLSVLRSGPPTWTNDTGSIRIPPGTRFIVYTMNFFGTTEMGQFDDNALTISRLFPTENLLGDPGAESGRLASPWWPNEGSPAIVNGPTYFGSSGGAPHSGKYMFYGGPVANAYISQTVDLSLIPMGSVDPLRLHAKYSLWFTDRAANPGSIGSVTLTFEDLRHVVVGQTVANGVKGTAWVNVTGSTPIPITTRYIVYTMNFAGPAGTPATGVFDDNSLVIEFQ